MSKITRKNGNLKAFASEATGTERTIFGDTAQSDTLDANITLDLLRGWGVIGVESNPTKQHFNGLAFTLGQLIAYLHQQGVPEWNAAQEYYAGSVVTTLAGIYRLKSGGVGSSDPDTDGGVNWELIPTQGAIDELYINAQWLGTPVGGYLYLQTDMEGVEEPPTDSNLFRYAKLTAGLTGLEDYNEGILSGESVAGGAPDIIATASISQGVLSGLTVSLLNTERRFIRPGSSGMIQSDEFRSHTHVQSWVSFKDQTSSGPESERGVVSTTTNTQASGGDETRPKNIGVTAYMRIS